MFHSRLVPLAGLTGLLLFHSAAAESLEDFCEFEQAELTNDYWPVFLKDPQEPRNGTNPVIDLVIGTDGVPLASAPVGTTLEEETVILKFTGSMLRFTPAYACGEKVEGFNRHRVSSYFIIDEGDVDAITSLPVTQFIMTNEVYANLNYLSAMIKRTELEFTLTVTAEGLIENMKGTDEPGNFLAEKFFTPMLPRLKFIPAKIDGVPVPVDMKFRLRIQRWGGAEPVDGLELTEVRKPMPHQPKDRRLEAGKIHTVMLDFDRQGSIQEIQFLSLMNHEESLAALNAFRNWNISPAEAGGEMQKALVVRYAFSDESDRADLIEESQGPGRVPPKPLKRSAPIYPQKLRRQGLAGLAVVVFVVDRDGKVQSPIVDFATHPEFADSARNAVRKWKFEPGQVNGQPVATRVRLPIPFRFQR